MPPVTFTDVTTVVDDRRIEIHHKDGGMTLIDLNNVRVPHKSFLSGKHIVFCRKSDGVTWVGEAWTKGVDSSGYVRRIGADLYKMLAEFESQYGMPNSVYCFASRSAAREMFPDFYT